MPHPDRSTRTSTVPPAQVVAIACFVLAGCLASYLLFVALKDGPVAGCGEGSSCDTVLKSRWAYLVPGVPVTAPALFTYLALLFGLFFKRGSEAWKGVFLVGSLMVIGAALWFFGLQVFVLKAYCKWCLATHALGVAGAIFLLSSLRPIPRELKPIGVAAAAMGLAMMAGAQILMPQGTTASTELGEEGLSGSGKEVEIAGLNFDIKQFPYRGNPGAAKRMVILFDYTCSSCRRMHDYLTRAEARFGKDKFLLVMLPTPLNPDCNRYMKESMPDHRNACLFAAIGIALWSIDREKFDAYDRWMIETGSPSVPPEAAAARAKAEELVGKEALAAALANPQIPAKLESVTKLWNTLKEKSGRMAMPKLLWDDGTLTEGATGSEFELFELMGKKLGVVQVN